MVADSSGPILLELWRDAVDPVLRDVYTWTEEGHDPLWVEIRYVWCRNIRGLVMPTMKKLVSNERTVISRCTTPPGTGSAVSLSPDLYISDFQRLPAAPPFTISVRGVVANMQEEVVSQSGNSMKNFRLVDQTGRYVQCVSFGRHSENSFLAELNEVVLYYAKAVEGLNGGHGQLWMYDDSHIVLTNRRHSAPPARTFVELR